MSRRRLSQALRFPREECEAIIASPDANQVPLETVKRLARAHLALLLEVESLRRDKERLKFYFTVKGEQRPQEFLEFEMRIITGDDPTLDEWIAVIDKGIAAMLPDPPNERLMKKQMSDTICQTCFGTGYHHRFKRGFPCPNGCLPPTSETSEQAPNHPSFDACEELCYCDPTKPCPGFPAEYDEVPVCVRGGVGR